MPSDLYRYDDGLQPEVQAGAERPAGRVALKKGFAQIHRTWQAGDKIELDLPMPVRRVVAHAAVKDDVDKFAIERGPLVYCAEGTDNGGRVLAKVLGNDAVRDRRAARRVGRYRGGEDRAARRRRADSPRSRIASGRTAVRTR